MPNTHTAAEGEGRKRQRNSLAVSDIVVQERKYADLIALYSAKDAAKERSNVRMMTALAVKRVEMHMASRTVIIFGYLRSKH